MKGIKVINPGFLATVQDLGRKGYKQYGMPIAGAMDAFALRAGNLLVGNKHDEAGLEITFPGFECEFLLDYVISITGADLGAKINGRYIPLWKSIKVKAGDHLIFNELKSGCRAYLSISGGIDVPVVMGSKSTYIRGNIGGYKGRKLISGDIININEEDIDKYKLINRRMRIADIPQYKTNTEIRIIMGPQKEAFTEVGIKTLLSSSYKITRQADRMGYRLEGNKIEHIHGPDIISDGIPLGAIQVPGHGNPIIMLSDRQTTGGYAKIATVISVDIPMLAQMKMGDVIRFKVISIESAKKLLVEQERILKDIELSNHPIKESEYMIKLNGKNYNVFVEEYDDAK